MKLTPEEQRGAMLVLHRLKQLKDQQSSPGPGRDDNIISQIAAMFQQFRGQILAEIMQENDLENTEQNVERDIFLEDIKKLDELISKARKYGVYVVATPDAAEMLAKSDLPDTLLSNIIEAPAGDRITELQEDADPEPEFAT
jgi:hypothetical protein